MTKQDFEFLRKSIKLACDSIRAEGGPFGAIIVKENTVIATGQNSVVSKHDPTAHAEIQAIRAACGALQTHDLSGCTIYTSCEPCPMCLGAIYWARLDGVYYGASRKDACNAGFDDEFFYDQIGLEPSERRVPFTRALNEEALAPFREWLENENKVPY